MDLLAPFKTGDHLKVSQVAGLYSDWDPRTATAIALAESRGIVGAQHRNTDGSIDRGLFQINSVHSEYDAHKLLTDESYNAAAAHAIWKAAGNSWTPWSTYNNQAYKKYLGHDGLLIGGTSHLAGVNEANDVAGAASDAAHAATGGIDAIGSVVSALTKASTYARLGKGALGGVLLILGVGGVVYIVTKNVPAPVKKAAELAAL